ISCTENHDLVCARIDRAHDRLVEETRTDLEKPDETRALAPIARLTRPVRQEGPCELQFGVGIAGRRRGPVERGARQRYTGGGERGRVRLHRPHSASELPRQDRVASDASAAIAVFSSEGKLIVA